MKNFLNALSQNHERILENSDISFVDFEKDETLSDFLVPEAIKAELVEVAGKTYYKFHDSGFEVFVHDEAIENDHEFITMRDDLRLHHDGEFIVASVDLYNDGIIFAQQPLKFC